MATPGMTIRGDEKLIRALNTIGDKVFKKHLRAILRKEARPIANTAKQFAKRFAVTGLLWKSLGVQTSTLGLKRVQTDRGFRTVGTSQGMNSAIGPQRGKGRLVLDPKGKRQSDRLLAAKFSRIILRATSRKERKKFGMVFRNPTRYAHLVEGGRKSGNRGIVAARPFIRPSFDKHRNTVIQKVIRGLMRAVAMEARRSA